MRERKPLFKHLNNRGFSLTELLVAIAILGVVSMTIYSFMIVGSRFYGKQASDADIQTEAQKIANTITNLIIDCELNVAYEPQSFATDKDGVGNARALEITNNDYRFLIYPQSNGNYHNLYYLEQTPTMSGYPAYDPDDGQLLAENVTGFYVDTSRLTSNKIISYTLLYEKGGRTYKGTYQVDLRNDVTISSNNIVRKDKTPSCSRVVVTPEVTVDVKGNAGLPARDADIPAGVTKKRTITIETPLGQMFTANAKLENVSSQDIFNWSFKNGDDGTDGSTFVSRQPGEVEHGKFYTATFVQNKAPDVPSKVEVIATSQVADKATGNYPSGSTFINYRKVNSMTVAPTSGISEGSALPKTSVVVKANVTGFNLTANDMKCRWYLEYKIGEGGAWAAVNNSKIATLRLISASSSQAGAGSVASSASVILGDNADYTYHFRVTAINDYDASWYGQYEIDVRKPHEDPAPNVLSRGLEIDLFAYFTDYAPESVKQFIAGSNLKDIVEIRNVKINNVANFDEVSSEMFQVINRDGKWYMYFDYNAYAYQEANRMLSYFDNQEISMILTVRNSLGQIETQTVNWTMDPSSIAALDPDAGSSIVLTKGGRREISGKVYGWNIGKKNQIGFYIYNNNSGGWQNANVNEYSMVDLSRFLGVEYTGSVGNRYNLVDIFRFDLTAKTTASDYPTGPIRCRVTLDDMYRIAFAQNDSRLGRACYDLDVYIANVEGTDVYVQGPVNNNAANWKYLNASKTEVAVPLNTEITIGSPSNVTVTFSSVLNNNGDVSYYKMTYQGKEYYWNSTYNCWRALGS